MSDFEHLTITLPAPMAAELRRVVEQGEYASESDVVQAALQEWRTKQVGRLEALRAEIQRGLADVAAGRVEPFDPARLVEQGTKLRTHRSRSD